VDAAHNALAFQALRRFLLTLPDPRRRTLLLGVTDTAKHPEAVAALRDLGLPWVFHRIGSMFCLFFTSDPVVDLASAKRGDSEKFSRFFNACLDRGVYFAPSQFETGFLSTAHTAEDVERTAAVVREALARS
jgi:glutamate-1-semialdehyde aminotransferase